MTQNSLAGAVAVVTGASSGIGAATARALAREGAAVALVARRRDRLDELAAEIGERGGRARVIEADITDPARAEAAVQEASEAFGRLDILVNNAGIMLLGPALQTPVSDWDRMISLNVAALVHVTHAALPHLIEAAATSPRGVADIVNISSTAGRVARPASSVYNLTKFGLTGFAESLRQELLAQHVRVSIIEPGTVDTELVTHLTDAVRDAAQRQSRASKPFARTTSPTPSATSSLANVESRSTKCSSGPAISPGEPGTGLPRCRKSSAAVALSPQVAAVLGVGRDRTGVEPGDAFHRDLTDSAGMLDGHPSGLQQLAGNGEEHGFTSPGPVGRSGRRRPNRSRREAGRRLLPIGPGSANEAMPKARFTGTLGTAA